MYEILCKLCNQARRLPECIKIIQIDWKEAKKIRNSMFYSNGILKMITNQSFSNGAHVNCNVTVRATLALINNVHLAKSKCYSILLLSVLINTRHFIRTHEIKWHIQWLCLDFVDRRYSYRLYKQSDQQKLRLVWR